MTRSAHSDHTSDGQDSSPDSFEFPTTTSDACAADDAILDGKLLRFVAPPPPRGGAIAAGEYHPKLMSSSQQRKKISHTPSWSKVRPSSRWYVLVLGSGRVPTEMDMEEIRTRQRRQRPRREAEGKWGPWKLLRSLSCRAMEAVVDS